MSGHSKWATIKRKKGATDAKRGKIYTKLIKEITIAARMGGGDPGGNARLRHAIDAAKAENMPGDNIERAIKRGTGDLEGVNYEDITYEGVGPAGTLFLVDATTDNRNRTSAEMRKVFDIHGGQMGAAGSAAWAFDEKGILTVAKDQANEERIFEVAAGAGAEDVEGDDDQWVITTERTDLDSVGKALSDANIEVASAELAKLPKNKKTVSGRDAEVLMNLFNALEDHDDVSKVFGDFELDDEALEKLG
jgi:YebC/PmpR family DNA-binding regulatory protein